MFTDVCKIIRSDIDTNKAKQADLLTYVQMRLEKSLQQYTQELDKAVESLSTKNNINVLNRYSKE